MPIANYTRKGHDKGMSLEMFTIADFTNKFYLISEGNENSIYVYNAYIQRSSIMLFASWQCLWLVAN